METMVDFIFLGSKITVDSDWNHKIKRRLLLVRKATTNLESILKCRDITLPTKVCTVNADFSSSHVRMWELHHKEGWELKNWSFWTVLLEKEVQKADFRTSLILFFVCFCYLNFILFLKFTILYWFCQISKWIHHRYTCGPHPEPSALLPPHTIPLSRPSAPAPSIQYHASNLDWWLISYMILYMFQCHSPKSSSPLPLQQSP